VFGPRLPPTKGSSMTHVQPALFGAPQGQLTSDDYYTPAWLFDRMGLEFDLDVCAPPGGVPWIPAAQHYTMEIDGLAQEWHGLVWMNPPFGKPAPWVERFVHHANGVCLVPVSTAPWFRLLWDAPGGYVSLFGDRALFSERGQGEVGIPLRCMLFGFGQQAHNALRRVESTVRAVA